MNRYKSMILGLLFLSLAGHSAKAQSIDAQFADQGEANACRGTEGGCVLVPVNVIKIRSIAFHRVVITGVRVMDGKGNGFTYPFANLILFPGESFSFPLRDGYQVVDRVAVETLLGGGRFLYEGLSIE